MHRKVDMEQLFVSGNDDGKAIVRSSFEALDELVAKPQREDQVLQEAVELTESITSLHSDNFEIKAAAGELVKQLIIAQGVPEETVTSVSQEGIGELITRVKNALAGRDKHGVNKSDKKPGQKIDDTHVDKSYTDGSKTAYAELVKNLDKYYLNDNWLNGQEFVTGEVNAKDFSDYFVIDNTAYDPFTGSEKARDFIRGFISKYIPLVKGLADAVEATDKRVRKATAGAAQDDKEAIQLVKDAIVEMRSFTDPLTKIPAVQGTSLGNAIPSIKTQGKTQYLGHEIKSDTKGKGHANLPALDKEGVKKAAAMIKQLLSWKDNEQYFPNTPSYNWLDHSDGSNFNEWLNEADDDVFMEYYAHYDYHGGSQVWIEGIWYLVDENRIASALERWIDRSIK